MLKSVFLCAFVVFFGVGMLFSADQAAQTQPKMTPEEQKMMEAWTKAMTPGPQHAELAAMAGTWEFKGKFRMSPSSPEEESTGTAVRTLLLGGRVLQEKVTSTMMGQPFEGIGTLGYDNVTGEYWSTWNDNMGTGIMISTGRCANKKCEFVGTYNDAITGGKKTVRMTSVHEADREVHQMFDKGPDGKEFRNMELTYTRKK